MHNIKSNTTYCVYCHVNKVNGKRYIGQTHHQDNPNLRWKNGKGYAGRNHFWHAIQKYGWDNFEHYIIQDNLTKEEADELEDLNIIAFNTTDVNYGYNIRNGGSHGRLSEETKQKISDNLKGKYCGENHPFFGKQHTVESRKKMSKALKGKKLSAEHREHITIATRNMSQDTKNKMSIAKSGENHPMYGKHHSNISKSKMSISKKDRIWINKCGCSKMVKITDLADYISDGWLRGRYSSKTTITNM